MLQISLVLYLFLSCCQYSVGQTTDEVLSGEQKWDLNWFPHLPGEPDKLLEETVTDTIKVDDKGRIQMGVSTDCDDAKTNLTIDYDPNDVGNQIYYMCLDNESRYVPSFKTQPWFNETTIPSAYSAIHRCMNTTLDYDERLPTFGTHRPLWAKFGEYKYLPPQRWVHNLEHGTVVMLYHPCANKQQVEKLKKIVKGCLYRHIITPSQRLLPERPLALITWGKSLEMSIVHPELVTKFITTTALKAPEQTHNDGQYEHDLIVAAAQVSGLDDINLCPVKQF